MENQNVCFTGVDDNAAVLFGGGVLVLALGLLPQGVAWSQDFGAIERRLGAAVAEGEIGFNAGESDA